MSSTVAAVGIAQTHGPLSRTNTAPVFNSSRPSTGPSGLSQTMSHNSSSRSSQMSAPSTTFSSSSTTSLSTMSSSSTPVPSTTAPSLTGGPVQATNNIINQKADASRSLYQICVGLRSRLLQVPGFDAHLNNMIEQDEGEDMDPVSSLWRCLRKGIPLLTIYNSLRPPVLLQIPEGNLPEASWPKNLPKKAAFKFVEACLKGELHMDAGERFVLTDLFGDDTTGFVKVTQVINRVLDRAEERGNLLEIVRTDVHPDSALPTGEKKSYRDYVVGELVDTERKYVQDLENLHELKKKIEQKGVIPGDVVHDIFLNINAILDFQRRFLIKIETTNSQSDDQQRWGLPFTNYEESFNIYRPFIANQRKAANIARREFDKIVLADHPVVVDFNTLDGFLLKPMQRLVKYPMLLKDLRDKTDADAETKEDLSAGIEAANRVLKESNEAVAQELLREARDDMESRVEDWKNHQIDQFGELLLHGHFPVVNGKSDAQKEYTIYLFERILLCCKDANNTNKKEKLVGAQKEKKDKNKNKESNKNAKLQLKGRIFMTNVTDVVFLSRPGSHTVQIYWKGDPGVENFIIRFSTEDVMRQWYLRVEAQRRAHTSIAPPGLSPDGTPTEFTWMRDHTATMPNPYAEQDDDDEGDEYRAQSSMYPGQMGMTRNASSTSLRSRSTTGDSSQSLAGIARAPPPRFPMGLSNAPLSIQTQNNPSPGQRMGDSYFSPVAETPASSRTSTASSMFPFPRQGTPQGWEDYNRYTAPAVARAPSRGSQASMDAYQMNGRTPQRPSLPAMASQSSQSAAQQRSRSYSTPDINAQNGVRRLPNGSTSSQVPAVPGIPAHLHPAYDAGIPRSQNNSPNGLPMRANTQSPGVQRERLGTPNSYANAPHYSRSHAAQPSTSSDSRTMSPPLSLMSGDDVALPTQLKVKVNCDENYVTLVVAFNITYQSLIDRIDAKVGRFSNNAIARGTMRLRYRDEDGDFVTIESDDDIQIAFQEWREAQKAQYHAGQLGEIELFCLGVES
ncbi:BcCDC24, RhoGEF protein [Amylocarpus encephaloides]|uniref:BcCDC24, RhoGEF protein n=1 Tax=Amylocarpus encephaloides TaxID=45428 RepID=A0A9P8CAA9_9HELO|nr:BcCDC24, RhoGEF protein [Amylocarpus encephaloides]